MKTNIFKISTILFAIVLISSVSCKKVDDPDAQSAEDNATLTAQTTDIFSVCNLTAGNDNSKALLAIPDCFTINPVPNDTAIVLELKFDNCKYKEITRSGTVIVSYTRTSSDNPGRITMSVSFDNYTADDVQIEGTITSIIGAVNKTPSFTVKSTDMVLTYSDGRTIKGSSSQTFTMVEGFATLAEPADNVIEVSGSSSGTNRAGNIFSAQSNKVRFIWGCQYPVSGTSTVTSDKGETIVDFGDGECDNEASITKNGVTVTIQL